MRFAFVSSMIASPWGGSEELWSRAALFLRNQGHEVRAAVPYFPNPSPRLSPLREAGVEVDPYPTYHATRARYLLERATLATRRAWRRLVESKPSVVVISQGHNAGGFQWAQVCRQASIPYILLVQANSEHFWFSDGELEQATAAYTGALRVYCVSQANLDLLNCQLATRLSNGEVIWNPTNLPPGPPVAWPAQDGAWQWACVARLDPNSKGQDLLFQTLARPEWRGRPLEVNLYGSGPYEAFLRRLAESLELKSVRFHGQVADVHAIWQRNHMLVLPSRYEGLPLVLAEAMRCGRPAVVTDAGGNVELCRDGETGFVARAATQSLLAEAMERAWEARGDWERMGCQARMVAEQLIPTDPTAQFCERLLACCGVK